MLFSILIVLMVCHTYLINYKSNRRVVKEKFDRIQNDKNAEQIIQDALSEYYRILKNDSAIYMFCSWHHIEFFKTEFEKYFNLYLVIRAEHYSKKSA